MFCPQVDKIIDQLQLFVQSFDLFALKDYWLYLDRRLFSRLEDIYRTTVNKLRTSLYRYYVINTIKVASPGPRPPTEAFILSSVFPEEQPGEDPGVLPKAGAGAAGPG